MKAKVITQKRTTIITSKTILHLLVGLSMIATVVFNSVYAQTANAEIIVKGIVSDDIGPLPGVNIVL